MTRAHRLAALLLVPLLASATGALGQTVYRCGPEGRSYSDQPCPDGREVQVADPRTEAQRREAQAAAQRDAATAQQLRRERQAREAAPVATDYRGSAPAARRPAAAPQPGKRSAAAEHRTARAPKATADKQKAGNSRP